MMDSFERAQQEMEQESIAYYDEVASLPPDKRLLWDCYSEAHKWFYGDHRDAYAALQQWLHKEWTA